ncbi:MAG: shikimate kinase [Saprospiraceae bacterium]
MRYFLIGFMGSGKTTLGRAWAARLAVPFVDLDAQIETAEGRKIPQIFAEAGEAAFREIERKHLRDTSRHADAVVATGGGTPCFFDNMDWMNESGTTIYLQVPPQTLFERLKKEAAGRPLLTGLGSESLLRVIAETLEKREGFYAQAQFTVPQSGHDFERILENLEAIVRLNPEK